MSSVRSAASATTKKDAAGGRSLLGATIFLVLGLALFPAPGAGAEVVAPDIGKGMLALDAKGTPAVAYVRGRNLVVSTRAGKNRWRAATAASVAAGSRVMAFKVGSAGPVALVQTADDRALVLVRRRGTRWQRIRLAGGLPARSRLGWPGLVLTGNGLPVVAYTRWDSGTLNSQLLLVRVNAAGRLRTQRITASGFPQSYVAPPAAPVYVRGRIHVVEAYGIDTALGTIEWYPNGRTWTGVFIDAGRGDFPVGPLLAGSAKGTVYAAWTVSLLGLGFVPVALAAHNGDSLVADYLLDRALTTGLVLPASGPEVAANEWVAADELDYEARDAVWAGSIVRGTTKVELDGSITGFARTPRGGRDLLLARPGGLSWFRSSRQLTTRMSIRATSQANGSIVVTGEVSSGANGRVTVYRERPGGARQRAGEASLTGGKFSFVDRPSARPVLYRAVYTDPATGIPYGALLRRPVE